MDRSDLKPVIWRGAIFAMILSVIAAAALNIVGAELEGKAEAIYEGITMLMAASILTWMIFWMRNQSRHLKQNIENEVRQKTAHKGKTGIFLLAFLGVLREGIELLSREMDAVATALEEVHTTGTVRRTSSCPVCPSPARSPWVR